MEKKKLVDHTLVVPKSVGLTRAMSDLAEKMTKVHGAKSLSEYIRGLILLDVFLVEGEAEIRPTDVPEWFVKAFTPEFLGSASAEYKQQHQSKSPKRISLADLKKW